MATAVVLAFALGSGCRKPPDLRALCENMCSCGCDIDACMREQKARRDAYRTSEACSQAIDEMTVCEIAHGSCEKTRSGGISFQAPACGELLMPVLRCEKKAP